MATALITGATGFIGSQLAETLLAQGTSVTCLVRSTSAATHWQERGAQVVQGDLHAPDAIRCAVQTADVVYHLAGVTKVLQRQEFYRVNEGGTRTVLEACAARPTPPTVVLVSSLAAAGPALRGEPRTESDPAQPISQYGKSKRASELVAEQFSAQVPISVVRPPIVFGEGDPAMLPMFRSVAHFGLHVVPGFRDHRFSLIHVSDLVLALQEVATRGNRLQPQVDPARGYYFVSDPELPTYANLGRMIGTAVGRTSIRVWRIPFRTPFVVGAFSEIVGRITGRPRVINWDKAREATAGSWICSADKLRRETEYKTSAGLLDRLTQTAHGYTHKNWLRGTQTPPAPPPSLPSNSGS